MLVEKTTLHGQLIYILVRDDGSPIDEVARYMKHLIVLGSSPNTTKSYCTGLKFFYEYLQICGIGYQDVRAKDLVNFVAWLRNPYSESYRVLKLDGSSVRSPRTTNTYISAVLGFYRYMATLDLVSMEMLNRLEVTRVAKMVPKGNARFLAHVTNTHNLSTHNILRAKVSRKAPDIISPEEAASLIGACTNFRDRFMIELLLESGLRIGELLGLYVEDFRFDKRAGGYWLDVVDRGYHNNNGSAKSGNRSVPISNELMEMFDDYVFDVLDRVGGNHPYVFAKLSGSNVGCPLDYDTVRSAFDRYSAKIGLHVTPHVLRHTYGTLLYAETKNLQLVKELLGHSSIRTTADLYLHPTREDIYSQWSQANERIAARTLENLKRAV